MPTAHMAAQRDLVITQITPPWRSGSLPTLVLPRPPWFALALEMSPSLLFRLDNGPGPS